MGYLLRHRFPPRRYHGLHHEQDWPGRWRDLQRHWLQGPLVWSWCQNLHDWYLDRSPVVESEHTKSVPSSYYISLGPTAQHADEYLRVSNRLGDSTLDRSLSSLPPDNFTKVQSLV